MRRPRIKPEHAPYRLTGGRIRLGGPTFGSAAEVVDPTGSVWTLLESMDGSRDTDEIVARVARHHRAEPAAVRDALRTFVAAGYVEDAGAPDPPELTERDKVRYDRARRYLRWLDLTPRASTWDPQVALKQARVTVAGLGGAGGTAAMALAASGVGRLHCVDFDIVELSNLGRQLLYTEDDIGRPKSEAAVCRLRRLNSDIEITGAAGRVGGVDDVIALASGCDVLVLGADEPVQVQTWTNRGCLFTGTPWVDSGYAGPLVSVAAYVPGKGPCYECVLAGQADRRRVDGTEPEHRVAPGGHAVGAASAGLAGHLAAHAAISLITGAPPVREGRVHAINLLTLDAPFVIDEERRPDCQACGGTGGTSGGTSGGTGGGTSGGTSGERGRVPS
jgi:molybdopterin/thiamine biosynthesis adenylyltransferase